MTTRTRRILRQHLVLLLILVLYLLIGRCPVMWLFGVPCPGCGLTRACLAALRLDFSAAFGFHPLFWLILPALFYLIHRRPLGLPGGRRFQRGLTILLALAFGGFYLYRLFWEQNPAFAVHFENGALFRLFGLFGG